MINFVVAFKSEAAPLIEHFNLKQEHGQVFPVFSCSDTTLVICGIGRNNASAATAWLAATRPAQVWLNVGIAGHRTRELGTVLAAHKITEASTDKSWYPVSIHSTLETESLTTFDRPQHDYQPESLHDMEASGFYEAAIRFSIAELVHSVKIISDNQHYPVDVFNTANVETLIERNLSKIEKFADHLRQLALEIQPAIPLDLLHKYREKWRFTVTQQHQLQRLLQRRMALGIEPLTVSSVDSLPDEILKMNNAKAALRWLQNDTDERAEFF